MVDYRWQFDVNLPANEEVLALESLAGVQRDGKECGGGMMEV